MRNKKIVEAVELENRSKIIDLLRKNLNNLQLEFKLQSEKTRKDVIKSKYGDLG